MTTRVSSKATLVQALLVGRTLHCWRLALLFDVRTLTCWLLVHVCRPSHLPVDNPAAFSYFFDISGRRTCAVAPERFFLPDDKAGTNEVCRFHQLTPAMDIFSLGCVIFELMTDGKALFDLPTLLQYREVRPFFLRGAPTCDNLLAFWCCHCSGLTYCRLVARALYTG